MYYLNRIKEKTKNTSTKGPLCIIFTDFTSKRNSPKRATFWEPVPKTELYGNAFK